MMKNYTIGLLLSFVAAAAAAQQQQGGDRDTMYLLSPVTIISTQATERFTPATFSNLQRSEIQQRSGARDIPSLLAELPSITFYSENGNGIGYNYINLRGFDQRRISVMVNGIPQNDPEDHNVYWIDFPDLLGSTSNIQVQRGAGSAFYGPPAIGGSVNLLAVPFSREPGVVLESMFGFQELGGNGTTPLSTRKYSATINSGLVDGRYMFYGRLGTLQTDGYRENGWADIKSYFLGAARVDETMTTRIHLYGGPFTDGLVYTGLPKFYNADRILRRMNYNYYEQNAAEDTVTYAVSRKRREVDAFSQPHFEVIHEWRLSPDLLLSNTAFYIQGDGYYDFDGDWVPYYSHGAPSASNRWFQSVVGYDSTLGVTTFPSLLLRGFVGNRQWGWLPRLEMTLPRGTLTVGGEVRIHRSLHWGKIAYASQLPSDAYDPDFRFYEYNGSKEVISAYGHGLFTLNDNATLMADLQFVYNRYGISNEKFLGNNFTVPYFFINPRLGMNYNLDASVNVYANIALTAREPRLKNLYTAEEAYSGAAPQFEAQTVGGRVRYDFSAPLAKPERLFNLEMGGAYRTPEIMAGANVFWMEFADELIKSGKLDLFGQPVTGNADRTRHVGLEIEGSWTPLNGLTASANATLSRNRLLSYSVVDSISAGREYRRSLDGNPIASFPDVMGNLRLSYSAEPWSIGISGKYVGSFQTDNFNTDAHRNDAYTVFNADASVSVPFSDDVTFVVRGEINNLLNALYTMSGEGQEFFPAAERNYMIGVGLHF